MKIIPMKLDFDMWSTVGGTDSIGVGVALLEVIGQWVGVVFEVLKARHNFQSISILSKGF